MMNINKYTKTVFLVFFFLVLGSNSLLTAGTGVITITDRSGADQSSASSIISDNIHIVASNCATAEYQLYEGESAPGFWGEITKYEFLDDIYIYKKSVSQFVKITLTDSVGSEETKVIELVGGEVSAPVDDPILPSDYVRGMGDAGLIVEADEDKDVDPVKAVIDMKKAGFTHVRMHIGRFLKDKQTPNPIDEAYFKNLDSWIEQIARHGMYCHIGNKTLSVTEVVNGYLVEDQNFYEPYTVEMEDWWEAIADRYKYTSHRLAYQLFLETGKIKVLFSANYSGSNENLDNHYARMTEKIRLVDSYRNIIYSPGSLNDAERLGDLGMPYDDLNLEDTITTGSDSYYFSDFHKGFAGGGWHPGEPTYNEKIAAAKAWLNAGGCPLIHSACNVKDRVEYPTVDRVNEIEIFYTDLEGAPHPIPVTFLTLSSFYDYATAWIEDFELIARIEAMNRLASINPDDPDGDFLTIDYENSTCGSDPNIADTDQDNISDFAECLIAELDPNDFSDGKLSSDLSQNADLDGDGISNAKEIEYSSADVANTTITQVLNITDPKDSETAIQGSINNVWESVLHFNLDEKRTFMPRLGGGSVDDETFDHDGDGVSTLDEVNVHTWPLPDYDEGDVDKDYDLLGGGTDLIPFINNTSYILGYSFNSIPVSGVIVNQAKQGSENRGILSRDLLRAQELIYFSGRSYIEVPNTDFLSLTARTVQFHFQAENITSHQIIYKEGDAANGISLAIAGGKLISTVWKTGGVLVEDKTIIPITEDTWYAVALVFDGGNQELRTTLHSANSLESRQTISLPYDSIALGGGSTVRIGGAIDDTRVILPGNTSSAIFNDENFEGYMDELHVFNRVLSQTDISLLGRNDLYPVKDVELTDSDEDGVPDAKDPDFEDNTIVTEVNFLVTDSISGDPIRYVEVLFNDETLQTDDLGSCFFYNLKLNQSYPYTISKELYETISGTINLRADTTVTIEMQLATSLDNYDQQISIYPNPAQSHISITTNFPLEKIYIADLLGKIIIQEYPENQTSVIIDISNLSEGLYFISIYDDENHKLLRKIIKGST